LVNQR
jgi:hypothetical protein